MRLRLHARACLLVGGTILLASGCRRPAGQSLVVAGDQLTRVEELPSPPPGATPGRYSRACARRVRSERTGQEYRLAGFSTRRETATVIGAPQARDSTSRDLGTIGEYTRADAGEPAPGRVGNLRVDCDRSRVLSVVGAGV